MKKLFFILLFISFNNFSFAKSGEDYLKQGEVAYKEGDYSKAFQLWEKACNASVGSACVLLGMLYNKGEGVGEDYEKYTQLSKKAAQLFEKACNAGDSGGCYNLGQLYDNGIGVKEDYEKAAQLFEKACNAGNTVWFAGCSDNRGKLYKCNTGDAKECRRLAYWYKDGENVKQDYQKSLRFYEKACDADNKYCRSLGFLYEEGQIVRYDYQKAAQLYEKACDAGDANGCRYLGSLYELRLNSPSMAKEYYGKACDLGEKWGCSSYKRLDLQGY